MCSHAETYTQCRIPFCYTCGFIYAVGGMTVPPDFFARYTARHLRIRRLILFIFVGAVYHNALSNCAALLCRTQRRVAHMCSSTVSDTANRLRKTRKKKSSVVPPVSQRSHVGNLRQIRKQGKGRSPKRKGNRRCPFLFAPPRGAARSRRPQTANPPLRFSEKLPAR